MALYHSIQGQIKNVLHIFNWTLEANLVHTNLFISFIYHYNSNRFALKSSKALLLFLFSQFVLKHALTLYFSSKFKANLFHFFYSSNEIRKTQNEHLIIICQNSDKSVHVRRFQEYCNQPYPYSYMQQQLTIFAILVPKCCKYPFLVSKTIRGDIRLYFKNHDKNC